MSSDGGAHRGFAFVEYTFKTDAEVHTRYYISPTTILIRKLAMVVLNNLKLYDLLVKLTISILQKAFEALCQSTHLYGRRLVLEWASVEENVDQIRKRTAGHFHPTAEVKSKKSTLDMDNA